MTRGSTVASSPVSITVVGLPARWQTVDIGSVGVVGSASMSGGIYTVKGAGTISGTADNFRFVYQPLSGDGEIKVRLNSVENTGTSGRIGVMIRESLTSGSEYAFMGISPDGTFRWQHRSSTGGSTSSTTSTIGTPPSAWVRLVRTGKWVLRLQFCRRHKLDASGLPQHRYGNGHLRWPRGRFRQLQHAEHGHVYQCDVVP